MNDDKLKEWIDRRLPHIEYSAYANASALFESKNIFALITAYRQLEKANAELRTLLKRVAPSTATTKELYRDITEALYGKHKGE